MLNTEPLFVEQGVPVFKDHADPDLYWYLPPQISLAQRNGQPVFSFIKYRNAAGQGGGLLSFEVALGVAKKVREVIAAKLEGKSPRLVPVPFVDGSVQCVTLDAGADASRTGDEPRLINQVLGAAHPSLQGDNSAIFTLSLSKDGAEVVEAAMKGGHSLLGVIYQLDYTAMQPPLQVKVTANMKQIYRFLGASVTAQYSFLRADLSAAVERMRADKNLVIERIDTIGSDASAKELDTAAKMFTDMLVRIWFSPMLIPGSPRTQMAPNGMAGGGYGLGLGGGNAIPYNDPFAANGGASPASGGDPFNPGGTSSSTGGDPFNPGGTSSSTGGDPFNPGGGAASGGDPFNPGGTSSSTGGDPFNPGGTGRTMLRSMAAPRATLVLGATHDPFSDPAPPAPAPAPADGTATDKAPGEQKETGSDPFAPSDPPKPADPPAADGKTDPAVPVPPPTPEQVAQAADQRAVDGAPQGIAMLANQAGAAAAQALPLPQVTLQLKYVNQDTLEEFQAQYVSRQAVKRTFRPQGFFGLTPALLAQLPPTAFLEVDTDSEFWRKLDIAVHGPAPTDFANLGLTSAVARIRYGATAPVDASFRFAPQSEPSVPQQFLAPMRRGETDYEQILTYAFDASWTGDPAPSELRPPRSDQRDIYLMPQRDFRFVVVNASFTEQPDWTQLSQIQLWVRCALAGGDGAAFERNVVVRPDWVPGFAPDDTERLPWRLRFPRTANAALQIDYALTFYYKDGRKQTTPTVRTGNADLVLQPAP